MWNLCFKTGYLLLALLIVIMMISISQYNSYILASSPSFYRQFHGNIAPKGHVQYLNWTSYTSDGRTLNATIWLHSSLSEKQPYNGLRYGIEIFLEHDNTSIPSYGVYIEQQRNRTWTTNAVEYEPHQNATSKYLEKERTYALSNHGSKYINLSLDLDTIGYPDKYYMFSYVERNNRTLDETYPVFVPPTKSTRCGLACISPTWPNPIKVFPGDIQNFTIPISSNDYIRDIGLTYGERYNVSLSETGKNAIKLSFSPKTIELPLNGSKEWQLQITTPDNLSGDNKVTIHESFIRTSGPITGISYPRVLHIEVVRPTFIELWKVASEQISQFFSNSEVLVITYLLVTTLGIGTPLLVYVWRKGRHYTIMDLKKNEILQINATVMVGVLILLTLGTTILRHLNTTIISLITASIIFPFAVSSIIVVISKASEKDQEVVSEKDQVKPRPIRESDPNKGLKLFPAGIMAMILGFVYIIAAVITLSFLG